MRILRAYSVEIALMLALALSVAFFAYLAIGLLPSNVVNEEFSGKKALDAVSRQLAFGNRATGTENNRLAGEWLIQQLSALGWDVFVQEFEIVPGVAGRNIIAVRSPRAPSAPVAILATHYDTRLVADNDSDPNYQKRPVPGANSGGSGTAVLLELARTLDVETGGQTVCLAFLDAEDNAGVPGWEGQLGSKRFVASLKTDILRCAAPRFAVALDLVGDADQQIERERTSREKLVTAIWTAAANLDYGANIVDRVDGSVVGTHTAFLEAGIDAALLIDLAYPPRYTLADTLDKLSADSLERVGRTLERWLESGAPIMQP